MITLFLRSVTYWTWCETHLAWTTMGRYLASVDHSYNTTFSDSLWRDLWDKSELSSQDITDITNKMTKFLSNAKLNASLPIAEAMLQLKDKGYKEFAWKVWMKFWLMMNLSRSLDEMSSQIFVPFVVDVRLGSGDALSINVSYLWALPWF